MVSIILDLLAPKATANMNIELNGGFDSFIEHLSEQHKTLNNITDRRKFRVKGNFFSDPRATKVIVGLSANPKHYGKVGFDLEVVAQGSNQVQLLAEERVILGYLELKAVSSALSKMLEDLTSSFNAKAT